MKPRASLSTLGGVLIAITVWTTAFMRVHEQAYVLILLGAAAAASLLAGRIGLFDTVRSAFSQWPRTARVMILLASLLVVAGAAEDHFTLLLLTTVSLFVLAGLGLTIQLGFCGVVNFAGAAFLGVGAYTAAILGSKAILPSLAVVLVGGLIAAVVSSLLLLPILRTRGHYAALITIAFAVLFKSLIEVSDVVGGPQGLKVEPFTLLGMDFSQSIEVGEVEISFYAKYSLLTLAILAAAFTLVERLERSWIGVNLDAVRLDETAAGCFGVNVAWWKIVAFVFGGFLIGVAGAVYGMLTGFVAPNNFTFGESLILLSILLLGGLGNVWGLIPAAFLVVVVPEKFQAIEEYRFLLYAALVVVILLFRPSGLLPRPLRVLRPAHGDQ